MDADRPFAIYADGDPIGTVPATITVRPRCLRMIVPGVMSRLLEAIARGVRELSRRLGRGGGTTLPGRLLMRADPKALQRMAARLDEGAVLVSATNGKTTTSAMVAAVLERAGRPVVHNRAGSNMGWGVATALLDAGREDGPAGAVRGGRGVASVGGRGGEAAHLPAGQPLPRPARPLRRAGAAGRPLGGARPPAEEARGARFVLNADDPLVADLGRGREGVTYFGVEDDSQALPALQHAADSKHCRNCGHPYVYDAVYLGHMGRYRCPNCGRERPTPSVSARKVELQGMSGARVVMETPAGPLEVSLPLPGLYNVYNAVAATALSLELGASLEQIGAALEGFGGAFGRVETIAGGRAPGVDPAGEEPRGRERGAAHPHARGRPGGPVAGAERQDRRRPRRVLDLGCRLRAAGRTRAPRHLLGHARRGDGAAAEVRRDRRRDRGGARSGRVAGRRGGDGRDDGRPLYALPTYTALLELRDLLADRGLARRWAD